MQRIKRLKIIKQNYAAISQAKDSVHYQIFVAMLMVCISSVKKWIPYLIFYHQKQNLFQSLKHNFARQYEVLNFMLHSTNAICNIGLVDSQNISQFYSQGYCFYGETCSYAHGYEDLKSMIVESLNSKKKVKKATQDYLYQDNYHLDILQEHFDPEEIARTIPDQSILEKKIQLKADSVQDQVEKLVKILEKIRDEPQKSSKSEQFTTAPYLSSSETQENSQKPTSYSQHYYNPAFSPVLDEAAEFLSTILRNLTQVFQQDTPQAATIKIGLSFVQNRDLHQANEIINDLVKKSKGKERELCQKIIANAHCLFNINYLGGNRRY